MGTEEGKKLSTERIILIVISALLILAVVYIAFSSLSRRSAEPAPGVLPGTAPPTSAEQAAAPTQAPEEAEQAQPAVEATPTVVRRLALEPTPTPFYTTSEDDPRSILDLANPDGVDYFNDPDTWFDYDSEGYAAYRIEDGHLWGIDYDPENTSLYWTFNNMQSGNTYAEISATNGDCIGKDAVGLVIRIDPDRTPSGYALEVACDGTWRFLRHRQGKAPEEFIDWTPSDVILTGKEATNRLGLWGYQGKFHMFVNGYHVGEFFDQVYTDTFGVFGAYVRAAQTFDLTATFDDFAFWHIPFIP